VETVHTDLELLLLLRFLLHDALVDLLRALALHRLAHEFAGGQAHRLPQVLESLTDLDALFLDEVVLDVLQFD
jgi:ABC-type glutathione transport system ATPase component